MKSINEVRLLGNVGQAPEIRYTPGGTMVAKVSLATNEFFSDKKTNEKKQRTYWHVLVIWDKLAEVVKEYVHKGDPLHVSGKLVSREYEHHGEKRKAVEVVVSDLVLLGHKKGAAAAAGAGASVDEARQDPMTITDEDIPF